jgi:hypothetical protein
MVGPSRVGKSSTTQRVGTMVTRTTQTDPHPEHKPYVRLVAKNSARNGTFTTASFTIEALRVMGHPMLRRSGRNAGWDAKTFRMLERAKEGALQAALQDAFEYFNVKFLAIDELQHLIYAVGGIKNALPILDSWKCLVESLPITLILTGAYPLLPLLLQSPHLIGRKTQIHFPRYLRDVKEDVIEFDRILLTYSSMIRLDDGKSLRDWNSQLFEGSLGCIGLLKLWLINALRTAAIQGCDTLQESHLVAARRPKMELQCMQLEITVGEEILTNDGFVSQERLDLILPQPVKKARKLRPFEPKLVRYPVGPVPT